MRRCLNDGVGGASPEFVPFETSGATRPVDDGAIEKDISGLRKDELFRSANGDRGADAELGTGGGGIVSSRRREKAEGDSVTAASVGGRVESGLFDPRIAVDALRAMSSAALLESLFAANVDGSVHI